MAADRNNTAATSPAIESQGHIRQDGLEAKLMANRDAVLRWHEEAPLRLVAAALVDLGGKARLVRPKDLKDRLRDVLGTERLEGWWKQVQPELKNSDQFEYDGRKGTRLSVRLELISSASLEELLAARRKTRPKSARPRPAARLAEWVTWAQSDEAGATPGGAPPDDLSLVLRNLPILITPVALNRILDGFKQRVLAAKKPAKATSQAWLNALVAVLNRWVECPDVQERPPADIIAMVARIYQSPTLRDNRELSALIAKYVSRGEHIKDVAEGLVAASKDSPDGTRHLLAVIRDGLDSRSRVALWQELLRPKSNGASGAIAGHWLRLIEPAERAEVLSSLFIAAKTSNSAAQVIRLLRTDWNLSDPQARCHLSNAALVAGLTHEQLQSEAGEMLNELSNLDLDSRAPEYALMAGWKGWIHFLSQSDIRQERSAHERKVVELYDEMEDKKAALDRAEKRARYLGGELQRTTQAAELDVSRDAILVLGETLQRMIRSTDPPLRKVQDANAGIALAIMALGAETFGEVGDELPFDPRIHEVHDPPVSGTLVRVVAPGLRYTKRTDPPLVLIRMQAVSRE